MVNLYIDLYSYTIIVLQFKRMTKLTCQLCKYANSSISLIRLYAVTTFTNIGIVIFLPAMSQ